MNSTEGDISATRKSSRTRLKRDFGTDFIDPTTVRISDKTNRTSDVKRKSQTQSPPLNLDVEEIKKELGEPIQVATDNVRRSDRQVKPSAKMVLVAECAKEIKFDVRDEDQAYNFDDEPEEGTSSSNSYVPTNVKVVKRKTPTMYAYSGSTIDHEKNKPKKAIIQPPPLLEIYSPVGLTAEEEQRLNDEALAKVAVIRAANVQKILEKRSLGKISTGGQAAAQDEEIFRYVTSNGNSELLNKMPNRGSFAKGIPLNNKPATSSSSNPKFVQLMNRTIAVPPSTSSRPPIPIFPVVTSAPRPNQRPLPHMAPKLPVKVFIPSLARKINSSAVPLRDPKIELKDPKAELKDSNTVLKGITIKPRFVIETPRPPFKKPKQEEQEHTNGEKKPEILDEPIIQDEPRTMRPHEHCAIFNNLSTPKPRHGENTTSIRTVTIMPKSMHLNKNGESAGPSLFATNKRPPSPPPVPQPPPIKRTENRTVVYKGADGKMLVKNKVVVVNQHQAQEKPANSTGFPRPIIPIPWPIRTRPLSDFEKYQRGKNKSYTTLPDNVASAKVVRSVNKPVDSQYVLASDKNINLHPNQPQLVLPLPQPIEEQLQTEVKEEPKDEGVKEEPLDDYEHVDNDQEQEKTASSTSPVITSIVVPRPSKEYRKRRMPEVHYERKSASPRQIFLGAEEPMKDSTIYQLKRFTVGTISLTEQKTVERIKQEIPSSECSTASLDGDGREKSFETGNDEVIDAEQIRQKEALAQKITINEYKILDYMKSEDFKKCLPLEKEVTEFGKVFMAPNVLANVPEFSDSLYWSKPDLYMDLTRIHRIKYYEANKTMNGYPIKSTKALGPPQFEKTKPPVRMSDAPVSVKDVVNKLIRKKPRLVEVVWNGITTQVPEEIVCHLCYDLMRLCMRRSNYRGEMREYPAYRCLRKGCQTFRSIKKQIDLNVKQGKLYSLGPGEASTSDLKTTSEEIVYMRPITAHTRPSARDLFEKNKSEPSESRYKVKTREEYMKENDEEEELAGETVSFEYFTENHAYQDPLGRYLEGSRSPTPDWEDDNESSSSNVVDYRSLAKYNSKHLPSSLLAAHGIQIESQLVKEVKIEQEMLMEEKKPESLLL